MHHAVRHQLHPTFDFASWFKVISTFNSVFKSQRLRKSPLQESIKMHQTLWLNAYQLISHK